MRISDWSSDVCSSDLDEGSIRHLITQLNDTVENTREALSKALDTVEKLAGASAVRKSVDIDDGDPEKDEEKDKEKTIGRAPCRERVSTYGETSVVDVALKKNIKQRRPRYD